MEDWYNQVSSNIIRTVSKVVLRHRCTLLKIQSGRSKDRKSDKHPTQQECQNLSAHGGVAATACCSASHIIGRIAARGLRNRINWQYLFALDIAAPNWQSALDNWRNARCLFRCRYTNALCQLLKDPRFRYALPEANTVFINRKTNLRAKGKGHVQKLFSISQGSDKPRCWTQHVCPSALCRQCHNQEWLGTQTPAAPLLHLFALFANHHVASGIPQTVCLAVTMSQMREPTHPRSAWLGY